MTRAQIYIFATLSALALYAAHPIPCPPGFTDTGAHCTKPPAYGRGAGYTTREHCELHYGAESCEKCYSLYYPLCEESYEPTGCNMCSPICPPDMTDIGLSCQK